VSTFSYLPEPVAAPDRPEPVPVSAEEVARAVEAVRPASPSGLAGGPARARALFRVADAVEAAGERLAAVQSRETGRPVRISLTDVTAVVRTLASFAGWADKLEYARTAAAGSGPRTGVVAVLLDAHAPLRTAVDRVAPLLAAGCGVVVSSAAPLTVLALAELAEGLPIAVLPGVDPETLAAHPGIDTVERHRPAGSAAVLVFAAAALDQAVDAIVEGAFCAAGRDAPRLLVQESVADELLVLLGARLTRLRAGDALDRTTDLPPYPAALRERVDVLVREAVEDGVRESVWWPGQGSGSRPTPPVVLVGAAPAMRVVALPEPAPVLPVLTFRTVDEAVSSTNALPGLRTAAVWTSDTGIADATLAGLRAGALALNARPDEAPTLPRGLL